MGLAGQAQKYGTVKGQAYDSLAKQGVPSVTVSVLDRQDSSLVSFTLTDHRAAFELKGLPAGEYRLLLTHVGYHNSNRFFRISDSSKLADLGNIFMHDAAKVLSEVVITNEAPPVTMVGDTVQYNAGSFRTQPNANVEQLLKKLPGVQVDREGNVTAQGERVNRVLVDGKEFFSNDPKIATRNLPADAVDKVQVYDRQSDQAQLTGFEDGNYEKTINLKLKKDKKKGLFGKAMASAGDQERYGGKFNVNSFKGARQLSAIGMANNTNEEGFSFMDILNFTGALSQMRQGGNVNITLSAEDAAALGINSNQQGGINTTWAGGLNYNNIVGNKLDLQSNYFYNRYNPYSNSRLQRQNILPGGSNFYQETGYTDNLSNSHRLNLNLLYQIDSMHSLRITPSFSYQDRRNISQKNYATRLEDGTLINQGFSNSLTRSEGYNFRNDLIFRKKFARKGRTFSFTLGVSLNESDGDGTLESIINYYNNGSIAKRDTLDQRSFSNNDLRGYNTRLVYTEPLWKKSLLELSAGRNHISNRSEILTYDYNRGNGKYDELNERQSNDFENGYSYNTAGVRICKQGKKYNYALGLSWQHAELEGRVISDVKDSLIGKDFRNLLPTADFRYNFSRFRNLSLNYSTSTNQPSMQQLQPVPDNSNPLYIREGNPDLRQEFTHRLRANLNLLSPYRNRNFFLNFTATSTSNRIVNYDSVDLATGVRRTMPVNIDGVYSLSTSLSYSMPVRFLKATFEIGTGLSYNKGKQFINKSENSISTLNLRPRARLDFVPNEKLNLGLGASFGIYRSRYSLESTLDNKYLSQEYNATADWQLPGKFFLSSDFTYTFNSQRAAGFNTDVPIWNASISKQFLKFNRGEIKFSVYDLLNRNTGISRSTNQNYIEDREVNNLKRFFLVGFTYSLSRSGLQSGGTGGTIRLSAR